MIAAAAPLILPILAVIAAVTAIGVGIYELYTHWNTVWGFIKKIVGDAVTFIKDHWQLLVEILLGPFALAIGAVIKFRSQIEGFFTALPGDIENELSSLGGIIVAPFTAAWSGVQTNIIQPVTNFFTGLPNKVEGWLGSLGNAITSPFKTAWNWIDQNMLQPVENWFKGFTGSVSSAFGKLGSAIAAPFKDAWTEIKGVLNTIISGANDLINGYNKIPFAPNIPDIPHLARGGPAAQGKAVLVGERGPELFVPSSAGHVIPNDKLMSRGGTPTGAGAGQHIEVHGYNLADPKQTANEIGWKLRFAS
jgi:phage-related protein